MTCGKFECLILVAMLCCVSRLVHGFVGECRPCHTTVNVEMFALYIFSRNSRFLNIRENIYAAKNTFIIAYRDRENLKRVF